MLGHGFLGNPSWNSPRKVLHCEEGARPGYDTVPAHEYEEEPAELTEKVAILACLIKLSSNFIAYTGAGISTSSGIADYASKSKGPGALAVGGATPLSFYDLEPTTAHYCLAALHSQRYLKWWCQQNHDGLPQKAGLPQHAINEIHGSWFDPSNPVITMGGQLRGDLFEDLLVWERAADLCLAVGTSLSGMNADRLVESCGQRGLHSSCEEMRGIVSRGVSLLRGEDKEEEGKEEEGEWADLRLAWQNLQHSAGGSSLCLGSVIITVQETRLDYLACLRIFAPIDNVLSQLMTYFPPSLVPELPPIEERVVEVVEDQFTIRGYDAETGLRSSDSSSASDTVLLLDLRPGSTVRITLGSRAGSVGEVVSKTRQGHYKILFQVPLPPPAPLSGPSLAVREDRGNGVQRMKTAPLNMVLGSWMITSALQGRAKYVPVVNVNEP